MNFGNNLQYLRRLRKNMTQEALAEQLGVSRQTVSKWESNTALPEIGKAVELCRVFNCSLDNLFREEMDKRIDAFSDLRVEEVKGFRYIDYTVISADPEGDALGRMFRLAEKYGDKNPRIIGWDFPNLSAEQINVHRMHGYTAAWILPEGPEGLEIPDADGLPVKEQGTRKYAAIHIPKPFENPFVTIPGAYQTLDSFMMVNGLSRAGCCAIPCFETAGDDMDVYIACD